MKLSHLFVAGLLLLASCTPENRVIENPVYTARNNNTIEVSKVSLTDSTTVLEIQATYTPGYWIKVASNSLLTDNNGNTYPLTSGIGIDLDKEFWMPESGEATFQLVFPPLKRGAKTIDFIEGAEAADGFRIWNIQLKENAEPKINIPKDLAQAEVDKNAPLTEPAFIYGPATIKGKVLGYTKGMPDKITIEDYNPFYGGIMGNEYPETTLKEDGSFSCNINLLGMTRISLNYADNYIQIWGMPNETSEVCINMPEITRGKSKIHADKASYGEAIYYKGPWEALVKENAKKSTIVYDTSRELSIPHQELLNTSFEAFKDNEIKIYETIIEKANQSGLSQATKDYIKVEAAARMMSSLIMAPDNHISLYQRKEINNKSKAEILAYYDKMKQSIPADFYQLPKKLEDLLNSTIAITTNPYPSLLRINGNTSTMKEGLLKSMKKTLAIVNDLHGFTPLINEQKEEMKSLPEACQQYLNDANEKLLATLEANKKKKGHHVNEVGDVANEKLFETIISKFRGKVLLVDFWATWCGPCRAANKEMKPMKEALKDRDIVYVYITGETSDKTTWEQMIPDLKGEHFYLTEEQWEYLGDSLDIDGVPTYYIIDREGNTSFRSVGYPGTSKMKEELEKTL